MCGRVLAGRHECISLPTVVSVCGLEKLGAGQLVLKLRYEGYHISLDF